MADVWKRGTGLGDARLDERAELMFGQIVATHSVVLKKLGGGRGLVLGPLGIGYNSSKDTHTVRRARGHARLSRTLRFYLMPRKVAMTDTTPAATVPTAPAHDTALDALILAAASPEWCKVAVLIARTVDLAKAQGQDLAPAVIVPRIYALAENGRLSVQGNVRRWRAGEVRRGGELPPKTV